MGHARCLNIHGQRTLSSLGVTLHAICRSTRLSPCLPFPVPLFIPIPGVAPPGRPGGSAIPPVPAPGAHRGSREEPAMEEEEGARVQLPRSASKGAETLEHRRPFRAQQSPPVGREGWQTALYVLHGPHSWKQGKRGKRPLQSQQSRLFISLFVCSFRLKRLSRFTQVSALKKWANWVWTQGQLAAVSKKQKIVLIPWIGDQSTARAPWSFPVGSPPVLLRGCTVGRLWGTAVGGWLRYGPGLAPLPKAALPYASDGQLLAQA